MTSPLTPDVLAGLEARHLAFLEARLVSPRAAEEWRANLGAAYRDLLAARVGDVIDPALLADAIDRTLTGEAVERAARPVARRLLPVILAELRAERGTAGDRVLNLRRFPRPRVRSPADPAGSARIYGVVSRSLRRTHDDGG